VFRASSTVRSLNSLVKTLLAPMILPFLDHRLDFLSIQPEEVQNKMNHKTGHFWGDRFYSRVITDEKDFWNVYNYIDQNPVKAGLVKEPCEWKYSGAYHREHGITKIISFVDDTILKSELKVLQ
jgi:REP element-mobilizing transposase RayT